MKTVIDIKKEIKENAERIILANKDIDQKINVKGNKSLIKRIEKENQLLRQCELYLKTNPREEYLKSEIVTLKDRVNSINSHFGEWVEFNGGKFKNLQSAYKTQTGIPKILLQIKTLKFLLH